ncbi:two-component regulator propeller domain-containing protein [Niabella yanshanensis]|uniref:histidine kinase n=1 Tax=Niabella yanshanensis TaxID=577386 RepID=A0ABZ0W5S6_9BACT|nr:two-component regulator propeller domain-containing protein [Niabella yanshanensis]WQD38618.1 two-component regulator propeller domain-containing protein [Niabella yanshanensis]
MKQGALILFILISAVCFGQPYYFRHYQVEDGLSNNTVGCVLQDHKGFLWFGTKDGLNRFDGYTFKVFQNEGDTLHGIGSNFIISLHEDKKHQLWVGTDRGLYRYNTDNEDFEIETAVPVNEIRGILSDDRNRLWLIIRNQLGWLDRKSGRFIPFDQLKNFGITSVSPGADGTIWVASSEGIIHRVNTTTLAVKSYNVFGQSATFATHRVQKVFDTGKGLVLVGTISHGLYILNTATGQFEKKQLPGPGGAQVFIRDFARYNDNEYWIASEAGLFVYNMESGAIIHLRKNYSDPYSLTDNALYSLCADLEGGMWIGTYFGGINYYPNQLTYFRKYFPQSADDATSGNAIHEIGKDPYGDLWIGTEDAGLIHLDPVTNEKTVFSPYSKKHPLAHSNIHGLLIDGNELWVGTFHGGLDVIDIREKRVVKHFSALKNGLSSDFVSDLLKTRSGKIIAATDRGICSFDPAAQRFSQITAFSKTFFKSIFEDSKGIIWAGSYNEGLHYLNPHNGHYGVYHFESGKAGSIISNRINWIYEDSRRQIWIGTEGGLSRLDGNTGRFTNYTTANGLPGNLVYAFLEDEKGDFWISTSKGLVNFTPLNGRVNAVYTKSNGLLSDQFNYNSAFNDGQGHLYFGSVKGLISFNPNSFEKNNYTAPLYLTGFQINNREVQVGAGSPLEKSIIATHQIVLKHDESSFSIDFAALSYTSPEATEYAYIMKGLDEQWTYLKANRKVFFTELAPGNYTFALRSAVSKERWSKDYEMLLITVLPPFWKSRPAYLLYAFILLTAIYFTVRSYHKYHLAKNNRRLEILEYEKQKEISQTKIDFFINVAHEIKTPLTLIKGPMEKVIEKADDPAVIKSNLRIMEKNTDRLIELTNQLLDFRKAEAGVAQIITEETDIVALLNDHYLRFLPAAEQAGLDFELMHPKVFSAFVDIEAMNKIVSNLYSNAIKYAAGKVLVELLPVLPGETTFCIVFKNDGHLIAAEMADKVFETFFRLNESRKQAGSGLGLTLSRSLTQLHGGSLTLEPAEDRMNVFKLTLPVNVDITIEL